MAKEALGQRVGGVLHASTPRDGDTAGEGDAHRYQTLFSN
jgi:hypothetical protein